MLQNLSTELESFRKNYNEMQAEYNHTATCIIQPNLYMEVFAIIMSASRLENEVRLRQGDFAFDILTCK